MDKEGFVYCRVRQKNLSLHEVKRIIHGQSEKVYSQFNNSYATVLNLYDRYKNSFFEIYPLSLHYFQSNSFNKKQAQDLIRSKLNILKDLGYIKNEVLSSKGAFASAVYGYELITSELYEKGFLEHLDKFELGILATAIVFEPRKSQRPPSIPKKLKQIKDMCENLIKEINKKERKYRIYPLSKKPNFHLANATEAWLKGVSFKKIVNLTDTDEGEIVRYFRMAVQILREIKEASVISQVLRSRIKETIRLINRDIIDAEKQLREN